MREVYAEIDSEREPICEGCGKPLPVSHSHLLSQRSREDLTDDKRNIRLHCFGNYNSCHDKWERMIPAQVVEMLDFKDNLEYIDCVDEERYQAIVAKFEFDNIKLPTYDLSRV